MVKAVLTTKVDPTYDDLPECRYHFPRVYLKQVQAAIGDDIVYYEPRRASGEASSRGGRQAYFAVAPVRSVEPDPTLPDHYYAYVEDYLPFARPVSFREGGAYFEAALQRQDGATNKGAFGRAVRNITDAEFKRIFDAGFALVLSASRQDFAVETVLGFAEEQEPFERPVVEHVIRRPFRDAAFAAAVKTAYGDTCAVTGLKLINGGGRAEVQAAHIQPVSANGPDSVRNGIALSDTVHWMFDRGLISITDDMQLLAAERLIPKPARSLLQLGRPLILPDRVDLRPHPNFLRYHREHVFKG